MYKKFDGSIHPELNHKKLKELQSKEDPQQSWWKSITKLPGTVIKFIKSHVTSSDESKFKHLPVLITYLTPYYKFITGETESNLNPLEVIDTILHIFESLIKSCFDVEGGNRYLLASDVKKVGIYLCKYVVVFPVFYSPREI